MSAVRKVIWFGLFFLAISALTWFFSVSDAEYKHDHTASSPFSPRHCDFHFSRSFNVSCYFYWTHGKGKGFKVPLALISRKGGQPVTSRDLIVSIPGGPGQGSMASGDDIAFWVEWLEGNQLEFDLLIYDPRGTSEDDWRCSRYREALEYTISSDLDYQEELALLSRDLSTCFREYDAVLANLSLTDESEYEGIKLFSSLEQARDIDEITRGLGYLNVHLWGTSYGSRLALLAAKYDNVKTLILDSPYAFEQGRYTDWPFLYQNSFSLHERLYSHIEKKTKDSYRSLYVHAEGLLEQRGVPILVDHWQQDREIRFFLNAQRLSVLNFYVLYDASLYLAYYRGLEAFVESGEISAEFMEVVASFVVNVLDNDFNYMVFYATECVDNVSESESEIIAALKRYPLHHDILLTEWRYDPCHLFDFEVSNYIQEASYADKPVLIFSGEFDPVTPNIWAQALTQRLSNARVLTGYNLGHSVLSDMSCDWGFLSEFIEEKSVDIPIRCENDLPWP